MLEQLRQPWTDRRAERLLGALACLVLLVILFMVVFVAIRAWPSFHANGLSWFGAKGNVDNQLEVTAKYGTDAVRMSLMLSAPPGTDIIAGEDRMESARSFILRSEGAAARTLSNW